MKIEYDSMIEETTEVGYRIAELAGTVRNNMWLYLALSPIPFAVVCFVIDDLTEGIIAGLFAVILYIIISMMTYKKHLRKSIRKMMVKSRGTDKPVPSEYEMDENGFVFKSQGQEFRFSWINVTNVTLTDTAIELTMKPTAFAIIPKRIFSSSEQMDSWIQFITEHTA